MRRRRNRRRRGRRNGRKKRSIQFPEQMEDLNMKRGNHFNKEKIWLSDIASLDGVKVWRISQKPVDFNKFETLKTKF
ncbi:hypothetical protein MAR_001198 [Mya arenaria]|uniref:Uncharacterized protein n=1 Tax=Mya arenaria TaxID=6604 RepID=A0ABY7FB61_MYAAR|nr:hypothetical protein MAR_001198 [Mya arenaria]